MDYRRPCCNTWVFRDWVGKNASFTDVCPKCHLDIKVWADEDGRLKRSVVIDLTEEEATDIS